MWSDACVYACVYVCYNPKVTLYIIFSNSYISRVYNIVLLLLLLLSLSLLLILLSWLLLLL